ncbi:MAG: DegT/DnrJ/EryC1/StrS family aminotransferase [Bdellovibrionales bacterium]|nr:DegT/DnrJ/EryC1/StrS family aminotransferase [Bdellovibrionales bacterium]
MNIPFVDLKAQYQALKSEIDSRMFQVLEHGKFILGPEVEELEKLLGEFCKAQVSLTCSNGTEAAVMAMMALGIGPGDEVIVPAFSFIATAETVVLVGANPVYVDIDPETYNIDPKKIEEAITSKTKAIVPVGLYGQPADMDEINAIAKKHKLQVIEDAAQSFGAKYKNEVSGNLGDISCTSFFPAKPLGCYGDGGAIFSKHEEHRVPLKQIRTHGDASRYEHVRIGLNGRLDTLQCAILIPKLKRFPWELEQRARIANRYSEEFSKFEGKSLKLPKIKSDRSTSWAQYTIYVEDRAAFQKAMTDAGVPTSIHYPRTMCDQPAYKELDHRVVSAKVSRDAAEHVISLPMYPDMPEDILGYVVKNVAGWLR